MDTESTIIPTNAPGVCNCCGAELVRSYLVGNLVFGRTCALRKVGIDPRRCKPSNSSGFANAFRPFLNREVDADKVTVRGVYNKVLDTYEVHGIAILGFDAIAQKNRVRRHGFEVGGREGLVKALEAAVDFGFTVSTQDF